MGLRGSPAHRSVAAGSACTCFRSGLSFDGTPPACRQKTQNNCEIQMKWCMRAPRPEAGRVGDACVCKEGSPAKGKGGDRSRIQAAPPSPGAVGMVGRRARPKTDAPKSKQAFAQSNHSPHRADVREHGHMSLQNHCSCSSHHNVRCSPCAAKPLRAYTTVGRMGAWSRAAATIGYIRLQDAPARSGAGTMGTFSAAQAVLSNLAVNAVHAIPPPPRLLYPLPPALGVGLAAIALVQHLS